MDSRLKAKFIERPVISAASAMLCSFVCLCMVLGCRGDSDDSTNDGGSSHAARLTSYVSRLAFSGDHRMLAMAEREPPHDLRIIDFEQGREVARLKGHSDRILAIAFSPDGRLIATGGLDGTLRLWEVESRRQLSLIEVSPVISLAFSPDSRRLSSGHRDPQFIGITFWQLSPSGGLRRVRDVETVSSSGEVTSPTHLRFSPNGRWVVFGTDSINVLEADQGQPRRLTDRGSNFIVDYLFAKKESLLLAFDYHHGVIGWDLITDEKRVMEWHGKKPSEVMRLISVAFRDRSKTLVTVTTFGDLAEWDLEDLEKPLRYTNINKSSRRIMLKQFVLSPDGIALAEIDDENVWLHTVDRLFASGE